MTTIAGVAPADVLTPQSVAELAGIVRELHAERRPFAFVGGETALELGNPPRALDAVVRTTGIARTLEYAPEDQTVTVEAGITFAALDAQLAEHGQMLPLDVPDRARTTIGGAIATNAYGPLRHRYGTLKDLIVGVGVVRPDGTPVRGGGKVVKNVAGFDLPKLMVGSLGTLGAIVSATLRVYPVAEAETTIAVEDAEPFALVRAIERERLEPLAIVAHDQGTVTVAFAGLAAGVRAQSERLAALARGLAARVRPLDAAEAEALAEREHAVRAVGAWRLNASAPRAAAAPPAAGDASVWYPSLGVRLSRSETPVDVEALRRPGTASVVVGAMPLSARGIIDAWGPPPASLPLLRAMKDAFDPHALCNPGRFVGGI